MQVRNPPEGFKNFHSNFPKGGYNQYPFYDEKDSLQQSDGLMKWWRVWKDAFSLVFGKDKLTPKTMRSGEMVLLISVKGKSQLSIFEENLRSNDIHFEIRNGADLYVEREDYPSAQAVIQQGYWE